MPKEIPMLFSTPMVKAILDRRKKMTRRTKGLEKLFDCSENHNDYDAEWNKEPMKLIPDITENSNDWYCRYCGNGISPSCASYIKCPYGQVGDILWAKETFYAYGHWGTYTEKGKSKKEFIDLTKDSGYSYQYFADWQPKFKVKFGQLGWHKRPSLFMPKEAARIFLRITDLTVERLQDITEEDAIAEGIEFSWSKIFSECRYKDYMNIKSDWRSPISSFQSLWASINGIDSWDKNPWVWVIEFERVKTIA